MIESKGYFIEKAHQRSLTPLIRPVKKREPESAMNTLTETCSLSMWRANILVKLTKIFLLRIATIVSILFVSITI
ncbi:MAG: hypothetical protein CSA81_04810 [Acidobacteria bacterium]|nr:MAG: hypothetical protein CSA81_04810 [Acidobacteriota bacterium]